jgi:hypothetical protein
MSHAIERMREEHLKALGRHVVIRRQSDMTDMAEAEPEKPLPADVPLHKRGFGVINEPPA